MVVVLNVRYSALINSFRRVEVERWRHVRLEWTRLGDGDQGFGKGCHFPDVEDRWGKREWSQCREGVTVGGTGGCRSLGKGWTHGGGCANIDSF